MKQLVISEEKAKELYKTASVEFKSVLEDTFGKEFFVEDIRDKVKTGTDAAKIYTSKNICFRESLYLNLTKKHAEYLGTIVVALIIADALNEGWEPDWSNQNEHKYKVVVNDSLMKVSIDTTLNTGAIYFKSESLAYHFMHQFPDICKTLYGV